MTGDGVKNREIVVGVAHATVAHSPLRILIHGAEDVVLCCTFGGTGENGITSESPNGKKLSQCILSCGELAFISTTGENTSYLETRTRCLLSRIVWPRWW